MVLQEIRWRTVAIGIEEGLGAEAAGKVLRNFVARWSDQDTLIRRARFIETLSNCPFYLIHA